MSYPKIFIHAILVVKGRRPLISEKLEKGLYDQITTQVEKFESKVLAINGCPDHVHLLISKFSWQKGPRGFSVSQSRIGQTIAYIQNQKAKHKALSFAEEFKGILKVHGLVE